VDRPIGVLLVDVVALAVGIVAVRIAEKWRLHRDDGYRAWPEQPARAGR
jgi:hypothetical protein